MKANIKKRITKRITVRKNRKTNLLKKRPRRLLKKTNFSLNRIKHNWRDHGLQAGVSGAIASKGGNRAFGKKVMNDAWVRWSQSQPDLAHFPNYLEASRGFVEGYSRALNKQKTNWVLLPTVLSVSAIVTVSNAENSIVKLLEQLNRLPLSEVIVVVHGSNDRTLEKVREHSKAVIVHYPEAIGPHVGRAIGAKMAQSDILVFLEGEQNVSAEMLIPFIQDIAKGADLALNNITPYMSPFSQWDAVTVMKHFLNVSLNRPDLHVNSLMDVPHALSRQALHVMNHTALMVPPKAQVQAILAGLRITAPTSVKPAEMSNLNRLINTETNKNIYLGIGDHVEALESAMQAKGERIDFLDIIRKREIIEGE